MGSRYKNKVLTGVERSGTFLADFGKQLTRQSFNSQCVPVLQVFFTSGFECLGEPPHVSFALIDPSVGIAGAPNQCVHKCQI